MALTKVSGPLLHGSNDNLGNYVINNITGAAATFSSVSVGGTLTYDDVTNVDSVGIVTARGGLHVGAGGTIIYALSEDNGKVGIGTTDASHQITVYAKSANSTIARFKAINRNSNFDIITDASSHGQARVRNNIGATKIQLNSNGDSYFTGGDVGIGTNNPLAGLHISDGTAYGSPQISNRKAQLIISAGSETSSDIQLLANSYNHIFFGNSSDAAAGTIVYHHTGSSTNAFQINNGGAQSFFRHTGTFDIKSATAEGNSFLQNFIVRDSGNNAQYQIGMYENSSQHLYINNHKGNVRIAHGGSNHVTFESNGQVGIGTNLTDPSFKLDVREAHATAYATNASPSQLGIGNINSSANTNFSGIHMYSDGNGRGVVNLNCLNNSTSSSADFAIQTRHSGTLYERFRITSAGKLFLHGGGATGANNTTTLLPNGYTLNIHGTSSNDGISVVRYSADYGAYGLNIGKSNNSTFGTNTLVTDGEELGHVSFYGADGTDFNMAAQISAEVDGTPSDGADMPGALTFKTSSEGSATPTERLRIGSGGPHLFLGGSSSVNEITESSANTGMVIGNTSMGNGGLAIINSTTGTGRIYFGDATGSNAARNRGQINYYHNDGSNSDYMMFATAGSERLRITSSGQIRKAQGANVTSLKTYNSNADAFWLDHYQYQSSGTYQRYTDIVSIGDGTWGSNMRFFTSANGSANGLERLRIDSSGRVGINTTTHPDTSSALSITNGQTGSDHCILDIRCDDNETSRIYFSETSTSANGSIRYRYTGDDNYMSFYTNGSNVERLRIGSDGTSTFDVGAPSSSNKVIGRFQAQSSRQLDIVWHDSGSLMGFNTPQNHNYIFKINDAEKFRFTSDSDSSSKIIINNPDTSLGQDQLIGGFEWKKNDASGAGIGTAGSIKVHSDDSYGARSYMSFKTRANSSGEANIDSEAVRITSGGRVRFVCQDFSTDPDSSNRGVMIGNTSTGSVFSNGSSTGFSNNIIFINGNGVVGKIETNGNNTTYNDGTSDRTTKKNFENWTEEVLPIFKNLNPQKFNFLTEDDSVEKTKGFIAQDLTEHFPRAYPLDPLTGKYNYYPGGMVVYLMKALQEEIVKREALEARISALEGS